MDIINLILSSIIVVAIPLIFATIILKPELRESKSKIIIIALIIIISDIFIYKYTNGISKSLLTFITCLLIIYQTYKITLKTTIILSVLFMLLLIIPELCILGIMTIFNLSKEYFYETFAGSLLSNAIIFTIIIVITTLLRKQIRKLLNVKLKHNTKIIIFSVLAMMSALIFFYDIISSFRIGTKIIFYIIAIFTFVTALIIVIIQENNNIKLKLEYDKLLEFMETYEIELENQRILRHEYKNQLITIKSKIIDKDKKSKVIDYINSILGDNTKFSQESYTKLQYLPANGIKALFYFKISESKNKGINTSINISTNIKKSVLNSLTTKEFKDLGILIGVYLDNAIEASQLSDDKLLGIEIYNTEEGVIIIISNSYKGTIDEHKIGKIRFSTKGKGRGYGLMLVNNTLNNNKIIKIEREITKNLYIQKIIIKKGTVDKSN